MAGSNLRDELKDISRFAPAGASKDLIDQLDEAVAEINENRPLGPELAKKLIDETLIDRVHSSAVTEGNRLSRRETVVVLTQGIVYAGSRKDEQEVANLAEAILEINSLLDEKVDLSPAVLRHLHKITLEKLDTDAGSYRKEQVAITGAPFIPPAPQDVPDYVQRAFDTLLLDDSHYHPLQRATWIHWAIARIHPFRDGNGRLARLLQDYVLLRDYYVPSTLQPEDRDGSYYAALSDADKGNGKPLLELLTKNALRTAEKYLAIIQEQDERAGWLAHITKAARERARQTAHRRFLVCQRSSNLLRNEFVFVAKELSKQIPGLHIGFRDYKSLELDKFLDIEKRGSAKRTWFFGMEFCVGETRLRYIFWFSGHRPRACDFTNELPTKIVIFVSREEDDYYVTLDELLEDRVTLREVVPANSVYWRRRFEPTQEGDVWDTDLSAGQIARDFFEEVLGKLGLV